MGKKVVEAETVLLLYENNDGVSVNYVINMENRLDQRCW